MSPNDTPPDPETIAALRAGTAQGEDLLKRVITWKEMTRTGKKGSYVGTANPNDVAKRRAKNKAAKAARRKNR